MPSGNIPVTAETEKVWRGTDGGWRMVGAACSGPSGKAQGLCSMVSPNTGVSSRERRQGLVSRKGEAAPGHQAVGRAAQEGWCKGPGRVEADRRKCPERDACREWSLGQRGNPQRHDSTRPPVTTLAYPGAQVGEAMGSSLGSGTNTGFPRRYS